MTEENNINVGDIMYEIFGYDATLVDFFQVTRVISAKTIELRKVKRLYLEPEKVVPAVNEFVSEPFQKRLNKWGRFCYSKWKGKPKYISAWGTY